MNIALIGYGKMGRAIEEIALQKNHSIVLKVDEHNANTFFGIAFITQFRHQPF